MRCPQRVAIPGGAAATSHRLRRSRSTLWMLAAHAMESPVPKTKGKAATATIHAVVGSDELEVKRVAAELAEKLTPAGAGEFGLEIVDGIADNTEQAAARVRLTIEALQTLPFFGSTKLVWLKNANFLVMIRRGVQRRYNPR